MSHPKMQGAPSFVPGTLVAGKYRLIKPLGEGAMGVVWSAVNEVISGEVALKLIWKPEPEYRVRLLREAKACGTVRHKNVIQLHDVGQTEGGDPFLVMELLSGETLADLLARKRRLPPQEAASIGRDVARGLSAAHAKGIVHRDLKPANIFLHNEPGDDLPVVKVLDFGVAKNLSTNDGLRTAVGMAVGSPMYMSPEQANKDPDIDARADIWSLGVVLFEMLTGERPFRGELADVLHQIVQGEIPTVGRRVRRIDPDLDAIVASCLVRRREDRLGPALEVARLLDEHATPGGREQLPSLVEEGLFDRASGGPTSTSGSASFSPISGSPVPQMSSSGAFSSVPEPRASSSGHSSPGFERPSARDVRPSLPREPAHSPASSPGHAALGLYQTGSHAVTEQLSSPAGAYLVPATSPAPEDDAATHRLDPRMLAPKASAPPLPSAAPLSPPTSGPQIIGPGGTVRIDPLVVEQAILARSNTTPPISAPTSSTAPLLAADPASPAPLPNTGAPARRKTAILVAAALVGTAALASVGILVVLPRLSSSGAAATDPQTAALPSLSPAASSATGATSPPAATTASAVPSASASASAAPSLTATAVTPPPTGPTSKPITTTPAPAKTPAPRPTATATAKPVKKCDTKFPVGCNKPKFEPGKL